MATSTRNAVIVGGGLSGLFSALLISDRYPRLQVHVVEKDAALGGGHGSFFDPEGGCFDHGMHLLFDSMVEEVDRQIRGVMDENDWIVLSGNRKDIAGIYHGGRLHEDSPYIDLRLLPDGIRGECITGLLATIGEPPAPAAQCASSDEFFRRRFGDGITDRVVEPVLQKLWRQSGRNLDAMASRIVLMDRVLLYDAPVMADLMKAERIRSRIGFPKQMELSPAYRNAQTGYYPRRYGMVRVIEAIEKKLAARGVRIHTQAELRELEVAGGAVRTLRIAGKDSALELGDIELLHWTIPIFALAPKLGLNPPAARFDPPLPQTHAHFLLKQPPRMGELYSFYCFDPGYASFRITSYAAYCADARRQDGKHAGTYPVCVELHFDPGSKPDEAAAARLAAEELARMGIIGGAGDIAFSRAVPAKVGFPMLTHNNTKNLAQLRQLVEERRPRNLLTAGLAPERGIFFLHDVLEQNYLGINGLLGAP